MDTKQEELIDGLQQQFLYEAHHSTTSQTISPKMPNADSTAAPTPDASAFLSKPEMDLPMLKLLSGDTMYFLTIEEFKQLPAMLSKFYPLQKYTGI